MFDVFLLLLKETLVLLLLVSFCLCPCGLTKMEPIKQFILCLSCIFFFILVFMLNVFAQEGLVLTSSV